MNDYKWKWDSLRSREDYKSFGLRFSSELRLVPLQAALLLPKDYQHKPGDVDYSGLYCLPNSMKAKILYHILTGIDRDGLNSTVTAVAACVLLDRLSNPDFLPDELNPYYWNS